MYINPTQRTKENGVTPDGNKYTYEVACYHDPVADWKYIPNGALYAISARDYSGNWHHLALNTLIGTLTDETPYKTTEVKTDETDFEKVIDDFVKATKGAFHRIEVVFTEFFF